MKRFILFPFLFAVYIVLVPLAGNLDQLNPSMALRPLVVLLLIAAATLLLLYALLRDWQYAGYLVFLLFAFFFMFGHLYRVGRGEIQIQDQNLESILFLLIWAIVIGILSLRRVWTSLGGRRWMLPFFNLVFILALAQPGYIVLARLLDETLGEMSSPGRKIPDTGDLSLDCSSGPDIYFIVLDAYGRADVLEDLYQVDNRPFLDFLEGKGFYVADQSYTNYIQTVFSIPAALNFSFIKPAGDGVNGAEYFQGLVSDNRIMKALKGCGYQTVAIESGFYFSNKPNVDVYLSAGSELNEFESLLLSDSPVEILSDELKLEPPVMSYAAHRQRVLGSFDKLGKLAKMPGPKIVFAHIISPHPPFIFDAHGQPTEPDRSYSLGDGDDYAGTLEEYYTGYARQVQFVNQQMEWVIDTLLEKSSSPPVIIIQGDHGPGSHLDWDSPEQSCLWERTPILNAYYLPGASHAQLSPSIQPVNSFRVVLNAYFNANLQLLPDRTYFTSQRLENQVIDITQTRSSRQNCGQQSTDVTKERN